MSKRSSSAGAVNDTSSLKPELRDSLPDSNPGPVVREACLAKEVSTLEIVIIGASTAGLYAAEQLARAGRQVAVFERQSDLDPARRTLIITPEMHRFLGDIPQDVILHRVDRMAVSARQSSAELSLGIPDLIVERAALTRWLAARAQQAGAVIHLGYRFEGFDNTSQGTMLRFREPDGDYCRVFAGSIIGADGCRSRTAVAAGLELPPLVPIVQAEIRLPQGWDPAVSKVWFDSADTTYFYWLIPESETHGVVGLVGEKRATIKSLLRNFLKRRHWQPLAYQGAMVAMYDPRQRPSTRLGSTRVLLTGDSAGHVKVTTVGGTGSGLWGAQAAVQALLQDTSYLHELRALNRELRLHWRLRVLLDSMNDDDYARLVACLSSPVKKYLAENNRDDVAQTIWKLPIMEPGLMALGLRLGGRPQSFRPIVEAALWNARQKLRGRLHGRGALQETGAPSVRTVNTLLGAD